MRMRNTQTLPPVGVPVLGELLTIVRDSLCDDWHEQWCVGCRRTFFARRVTDVCAAASCATARRSLCARRIPVRPDTLWNRLRDHFVAHGFAPVRQDNVISPTGETMFMSAALQVLDPVVHAGAPAPKEPYIVAQPVIRLNCAPQMGLEAGFSTSFVNVATEEVVDCAGNYARHLHAWLRAFRAIGLDEKRLSLIAEPIRFRGGLHEGNYLVFDHGGIELGEGIYIDTLRTRPLLRVLDFGFGLERLLWAVNGTPTYYDNFGPLTARAQRRYRLIDAARTTVLLASTGIKPGHRSHGYRLRWSIGRLRASLGNADPAPLLRHAFDEWSAFVDMPLSGNECVVVAELHRQTNLELCRRLEIRPSADVQMDPESFCQTLIARGVPLVALLGTGGDTGSDDGDGGGRYG